MSAAGMCLNWIYNIYDSDMMHGGLQVLQGLIGVLMQSLSWIVLFSVALFATACRKVDTLAIFRLVRLHGVFFFFFCCIQCFTTKHITIYFFMFA